ncbi:Cd(II)/Pb(II)-responsive transcriptional regulator [Ideonella sp. DXS29W]|uniref:Cd(II)/Pb(II)-responsive transcriptional regulator n=1 Tax=Ideonella lacteola TaxID=2984193 RepID=A0ABU9BMX4_9BURK
MKIGELAAQAGCDVQTVRFYEREGLMEAPDRESSGYRRYAQRHLTRLHFIRHCRTLDIPLADIRQLLEYAETPGPSCHEVDALLDEHIDRVRRQRAALKALEGQLVALRHQCQGTDGDRTCAILQAFMNAPSAHDCACHPR